MRLHADLLLVLACVVLAYALSGYFDLAEKLRYATKPYEYLQLDELPVVLLTGAVALGWFGWRRYHEARRELRGREAAEARLAHTLAQKNRLARQFIDAQEAERRSVARELHDELGQYLNAIKLDAVAITAGAGASSHARAQGIVESVERVHRVVQTMIRRFRPVALDELGLPAALEHSVNDWRRRMPGTELRLDIVGDVERCPEAVNLALYRIVQEGLTNVSRHARAKRVAIRLERAAGVNGADDVRLAIHDDGVGADLGRRSSGLGLLGMRERTELLGGRFDVASEPGHGLSLLAVIPALGAGARG